MPGQWTLREKWSLDAWDRVFDWDHAHPKDAATFLLSQGIEGNIKYLSTDALRCIGFTKLYETGRIELGNCGEGPPGVPDVNAVHSLVSDLKKHVKILKDRVDTLEKKDGVHTCTGSMKVFVKTLADLQATLEVRPCNTILAVKEKITDQTGVDSY
jgi:hypothetical protein